MNNSKGFKIARVIGIVEIVLSLLLTVAGAFPVGIPLLLIGIFIVVGSRKAQKKNLEIQQTPPQLQPEPPKEKENTLQTSEQESDIARAAYNSVMEKRVDYAPQTSEQYTLVYKDAAGNETRRVIDLQGFMWEENFYIVAYCHLRNAQRQFSLDRIVSLYDSSGNEIQNPKEYFLALYKQTPKYKTENALKEKAEQLSLLVFLARADGTMRKNEREIILKYLDSQIQGLDLDAVEKRVKSMQCDLRAFNQILKNAQQWPGAEKQMLLSCINQMYSLKKTPDPMEKAAFEKIKVSLSTN